MSLAAFQQALARQVAATSGRPSADRGLAATAAVRRSWCEARTAKAGRLTLSVLPSALRADLVRQWVDGGGGASAFHADEAQRFLAFVAERLEEPSHALTLCRLELALALAACAPDFRAPPPPAPGSLLARGPAASLVPMTADAAALLSAVLEGAPAPQICADATPLLVAPGVAGRARPATPAEAELWSAMSAAGPAGRFAEDAARLLAEGVLAPA